MKKELEEIRNERKKLESIVYNKPQKRKVEVIEYEDGSYRIIGFAWDIPLKKTEVIEAFESWMKGYLEQEVQLDDVLKGPPFL